MHQTHRTHAMHQGQKWKLSVPHNYKGCYIFATIEPLLNRIRGTPVYIGQEQISGANIKIREISSIFALSAVEMALY